MKHVFHAPIWCLASLCLGMSASALPTHSTSSQTPVVEGIRRGNVYVEIPELPLDALMTAATNVVYGKVLGARAVFPDRGMPYTEYDLQVYASFKHATGPITSVIVGGASRPGEQFTVVEAPLFAVGEEVVLLTWSGTNDLPPGILGLGLGTYRVGLDADGELIARRDRSGSSMPLGQLFAEIDAAVQREQAAREEDK